MKKTLCMTTALLLLGPASQALAENRVEGSGGVTMGVQQVDEGNNSSKFNEYRDLDDGFYLYDLWFEALDTKTKKFMDFKGKNVLKDDQSLRLRFGDYGNWNIQIDHKETPHNLSNKAKTPYIYQGSGIYTVPSPVPISTAGTAKLVPTAGEMAVNDALIAAWLPANLRDIDLGTQREKTGATFNLSFPEQFKFRFSYSDDRKDGAKITYATLGDRPPRTLNAQIAEPVDYSTKEMRLDAEYNGDWFQTHLSYLFSTFDNKIESLRWQNMFFSPNAGLDYTGTDYNVAGFGERSLDPDNYYHNVALSAGMNAPLNGRLTGTVAYGYMRQDETLLPYSTSNLGSDWNDPAKLARDTADAKMETLRLDLDYTFNPMDRLNMRAFVRYYDLDNDTPTDSWAYASQDTTGATSTVNYRNYRNNLAYAYDTLNYGLDARRHFSFWRTTLGLSYEREEIGRDYREADTDENIYKLSMRSRPASWLSLRAGYLYGDRQSDGYDYNVTSQSYWYTEAQSVNAIDNPQFLFANHPDLRKYDVSDRERNQFDLAATITAMTGLDVNLGYTYRDDDFDSDVAPVAPLLGKEAYINPAQDPTVTTAGQQLGLLKEKRQNVSVDVQYTASSRWSFNVFGNREEVDSTLRGMVFNENNRWYPDTINPALNNLGAFDDPRYLYDAKIEDRTNTIGMAAGFDIIPGKLRLSGDYTISRGKATLDYSGYGTEAVLGSTIYNDGEFQFAFDDPSTVRHNQYVLNASLEYQLFDGMILGLHYIFDRYSMKDWMQEPEGVWVDSVGSEYFLRDSTEDNRWGNRLVSMGSNLSPSYETHTGFATMTYSF